VKALYILPALALAAGVASAEFRFRDVNANSVELAENGSPVFVYNHGMMLKEGVPADRTRCCYLHPVYAPNGVVVTDDFPRDHYHHRGISWMWPEVTVDGKTYDLWTIKGILAKFEKWDRKEAGAGRAVLAFTDGWYIGDCIAQRTAAGGRPTAEELILPAGAAPFCAGSKKVVEENVEIVANAVANGRRDLDFTLRLRAVAGDVSIAGTPDQKKGYGGFNIRFAPRTGTLIDTAAGPDVPDSDLAPNGWAELRGDFGGKNAGARITIDPANPGFPSGWCLRHYGFLGVDFPGLQPHRLDTRQALTLKFRVALIGGGSETRPGVHAKWKRLCSRQHRRQRGSDQEDGRRECIRRRCYRRSQFLHGRDAETIQGRRVFKQQQRGLRQRCAA